MNPHLQTTLLAFCISLIFSSFAVNADTSKTTNSEVQYQRYSWREGRKYHRFLPATRPEGLSYNTRLKATANIDDTPERESVVLMLLDVPTIEYYPFTGKWVQAFLLIADETKAAVPKKKAFFKLFDTGTHDLEVPTAKAIELQSPAFVFTEPPKDSLKSRDATFRLVDLTGDGILDIWVEFGYAVAVISFQNGEFEVVFSCYTVPGLMPNAEYVDLDNDGTSEIKIPYSIRVDDVPGAPDLPWVSLYEWDGTDYVLNNKRFYADNNEFLIQLLSEYNLYAASTRKYYQPVRDIQVLLRIAILLSSEQISFSSVANELIRYHYYGQDENAIRLQWNSQTWKE